MDPQALARWQFGITTVYHYLFVPITIGLPAVCADALAPALLAHDAGPTALSRT